MNGALALTLLAFAGAPEVGTSSISPAVSTSSVGEAVPSIPGFNSDVMRPHETQIDPVRLTLELPEHFIELAFTPLLATFYTLERTHILERAIDLFVNEARTAAALPIIIPAGRSGPGFGALAAYNAPLGSPDRAVIFGFANLNGDWTATGDFGRRLPFASGRAASLTISGGVDRDQQFFGVGAERVGARELSLRVEQVDVTASLTLLSPAVPVLTAEATLAYRHRAMKNGEGDAAIPFDGTTAGVQAPPGFGQSLDYPEIGVTLGLDTRNSFGLTSRGIVWNNTGRLTQDVNKNNFGRGTGGAVVASDFAVFIPLALRNRTLFLRAGGGASLPFRGQDDIPYHFLQALGGASRLRGYLDNRFVDELAWWATIEYRWFFYEYAGTGGGLVSTLFFDVGQVGKDVEDLFRSSNLPWSAGFSLRIEQSLIMLGRLQFGFSPEGVQVSFGIGDLL